MPGLHIAHVAADSVCLCPTAAYKTCTLGIATAQVAALMPEECRLLKPKCCRLEHHEASTGVCLTLKASNEPPVQGLRFTCRYRSWDEVPSAYCSKCSIDEGGADFM